MFSKHYFAQCCLLLLGISGVLGQAEFMCPVALPGVSDSSKFPCGEGAASESSKLEVNPGPLTISWQDAAPRPGSSYRITLRRWAQQDVYCILQDRIPSSVCSNKTEGTGNCTTPVVYYITVNIPNVNCNNCYLQITTIFPNGSECLVSFDSKTAECPTFFTCANINIRSKAGGSFQECDADFFTNKKTWPFKTDSQRQNFTVDFRDFPGLFPYADGSFSYEPVFGFRGRVKYQVGLLPAPNMTLFDTNVAWKSPTGGWIKYRRLVPILVPHGSYAGFMGIASRARDTLLNGDWYIAVEYTPTEKKKDPKSAVYIPLIKSAEIYSDVTGNYSTEGWLTGPDFDGPASSLSKVITPAEGCLPGSPKTSTVQPDTTMSAKPTTNYQPYTTKSHPEETPKKPRTSNRPIINRAQNTGFTFVKAGSDSLPSSRTTTIVSCIAIVILSVIL